MTGEIVGELARSYRRYLKGLMVARPGYIPRVILFDEGGRFLVTTGSIVERLVAYKSIGVVAEKMGLKSLATKTFQIGDETVEATLPWRFAKEPLASNNIRASDAAVEMAQDAKLFFTAGKAEGGWDVLNATAKTKKRHLKSWNRALIRDFGGSASGREGLAAIAEGKGVDEVRDVLETWARTPENVPLRQRTMAIADEDVGEWADTFSQVLHAYTMSGSNYQREIARAVLDGGDDLKPLLDQVPIDQRPPVHGPTIKEVTGAPRITPGKLVDGLYSIFVRLPEDVLNRQPFYRIWKARAERALLAHMANTAGGTRPAYRLSNEAAIERATLAKVAKGKGYVFHATSDEGLGGIRQTWLNPNAPKGSRVTGTEGTPMEGVADDLYSKWEDGGTDPRAFFAEDATSTVTLSPRPNQGDRVLLRVRRDLLDLKQGTFAGEKFTNARVPNNAIEYLGDDLKWYKAMPKVKMTDEAKKVIDLASRDFALAQVKKTMFDFTKQSRFTELLQFVAPFPQPFFEGFQVWGHLVVQHPELIGRTRALFDFATETNFIKKDANGEYVVPMGAFAGIARTLGILPDSIKESVSFTSQLRSFNMLTSSSFEIPGGDNIVGHTVGGVPIPVPGLDPAAARVLQYLFRDTTSRSLTGWLFAYGPRAQFAPRMVTAAFNALDPDTMDENMVKSYAAEILKEYQRQGLDTEDGKPVPTATLKKWALADAQQLIQARNVASLLSPAALQVRFEHDEIEDSYNKLIETQGPDAAQAWLKKHHPDLTLIGLSKYYYTKHYTDPITGKAINAPKIPSSALFAEMVTKPGFKEFAARYPEWLGLLLIGLNPDVAYDFSPAVRAKQLAEGLLKVKDPAQFWSQGENTKVWEEIDGFYKETWNPAVSAIEAQGLDDQDTAYQRLILQRQGFFTDLYTRYPSWVRKHLDEKMDAAGKKVVGWDWPADAPETPAQIVMKDARVIASLPEFRNFPGVRALRDYLEGRDEIAEDMKRLGITDINSDSAVEKGLNGRYEALKKQVIEGMSSPVERFGERQREETRGEVVTDSRSVMEQFIEGYFRGDLTGFQSHQRSELSRLEQTHVAQPTSRQIGDRHPIPLAEGVERFDTALEGLRDAARRDFDHDHERNQSYQDVRNYLDDQLRLNPQVVEEWWNSEIKGKPGEKAYKEDLVGLPSVFWSRWDWKVMGVEMSDRSANWLKAMGQARVDIARREEADPVGYSEGEGYAKIDAFVREHRGKDKTFDAAVAAMNDWSYAVDRAGLGKQPGRVGQAWGAVIRVMRSAQQAVDGARLKGQEFGTDDERRAYDSLQDQLLDWVKDWHDFAPGFRQQWYDLQEALGDPLIGGLFVPDNYFGPTGKSEDY